MAEMNSGISDISTTIDESTKGINEAADGVSGIVNSIDDIEKEAENNIIIGQKLQGYVQVFKKFSYINLISSSFALDLILQM